MKRYASSDITDLLISNGKTAAASIFFFLAGISAGVFLELIMNPGEKSAVASYLQQYLYMNDGTMDYPNPFFASLGASLLLLLLIFGAGFSGWGFPAALLAVMYKGLTLGFSAGLLIESLALKGAFLVLVSMVPQNLIIVPVFLAAATAAQNYGLSRIQKGRPGVKRTSAANPGSYLFLFLLTALAVCIGCAIEGLLFPIVV